MEPEVKDLDIASLVTKVMDELGSTRDAVIPILSEINRALGYIPAAALPEIRRHIQAQQRQEGVFVADSHLYSAASFYQMFSLEPLGRHVIRFCESAPCHVVGGRKLWQALYDELHLKAGETSADGKWSLVPVSCLGVCAVGPVLVIDDDMYGNVEPEQLSDILARYD